jgi:hypothetical protein
MTNTMANRLTNIPSASLARDRETGAEGQREGDTSEETNQW